MPLNRQNIPQQIADLIAVEIIEGRLTDAAPVREQDWAQRLQVARSSVREALLILERRHLVQLSAGKGARVTTMDSRWLREVTELWYLLFETAVQHATDRASQASLVEFELGVRELQQLATDGDKPAFFDQAIELVMTIAQTADHQMLQSQLRSLLPAARRVYRFLLWRDRAEISRSLDLAESLLEAISKRDQAVAANSVRSYARQQLEALDCAIVDNDTAPVS